MSPYVFIGMALILLAVIVFIQQRQLRGMEKDYEFLLEKMESEIEYIDDKLKKELNVDYVKKPEGHWKVDWK